MSLKLAFKKQKAINHPLPYPMHRILCWGSPPAHFHTRECDSYLYTANRCLSRNKFRFRISLSKHTAGDTVLHLVQESIHSIQCWYHCRLLTSHAQPDLERLDCILKTSSRQQLDNLLAWYSGLDYQNMEAISHQRQHLLKHGTSCILDYSQTPQYSDTIDTLPNLTTWFREKPTYLYLLSPPNL